jgi:hypothetical protein
MTSISISGAAFMFQQTLTLRRATRVENAEHEPVYILPWGQGCQKVILGGMWLKIEKHGEVGPYSIVRSAILGFCFIKVAFDLFDLVA